MASKLDSPSPDRRHMAAVNSDLWRSLHSRGDPRADTIQRAGNVEQSAEELGRTLEAFKRRNAEKKAQQANQCCPIL